MSFCAHELLIRRHIRVRRRQPVQCQKTMICHHVYPKSPSVSATPASDAAEFIIFVMPRKRDIGVSAMRDVHYFYANAARGASRLLIVYVARRYYIRCRAHVKIQAKECYVHYYATPICYAILFCRHVVERADFVMLESVGACPTFDVWRLRAPKTILAYAMPPLFIRYIIVAVFY